MFDIDSWQIAFEVDGNDEIVNNRIMRHGYDNRRTGDPNHGDAPVMNLTAVTNAQGIARVTFVVTMQPGNNFRAFASAQQQVRDGLTQQFVDLYPTAPRDVPSRNGVPLLQSTQPLTVWRKLHIEQDSMAAPPQAETFNTQSPAPAVSEGRLEDLDTSLLRTNMAKIYIDVVTSVLQGAGSANLNTNRAAIWQRTMTSPNLPPNTIGDHADTVRDVPSENGFWVVQTFTGYFAEKQVAGEPLPLRMLGTAEGVASAVFFPESARREHLLANNPVPFSEFKRRLAYHEVVHSFGIDHGMGAVGNSGIFDPQKEISGNLRDIELRPSQINVILGVVKPD